MVKVIESNLSLNELGEIVDFQSRVVETESWEVYVAEIKNGESKIKSAAIGYLSGLSIPRKTAIEELKCDNYHLSFSFFNGMGNKKKMLAYLIKE